MRENELAELLIRMANDRGVDVEAAAEELASIALPSFVDAHQFRSAVIQALETNLRAQVEERLQSIRRRFDVDAPRHPTPARPVVTPLAPAPAVGIVRSSTALDRQPDLADVTMADMTPMADAPVTEPAAVAEEELPTDATMVWTTRHG
ncbi:MAG TPA: hypothetical protein VEX37_11690 [Thermomicrobiales bacterium]|nr:hypothetical protein [Thermomicrobiales bacterium]